MRTGRKYCGMKHCARKHCARKHCARKHCAVNVIRLLWVLCVSMACVNGFFSLIEDCSTNEYLDDVEIRVAPNASWPVVLSRNQVGGCTGLTNDASKVVDNNAYPQTWSSFSFYGDCTDCDKYLYVQFDLGSNQWVSKVHKWLYWGDRRAYCNQKVAISESSNFQGEETIAWSCYTMGSDCAHEPEDGKGLVLEFEPVWGRYVRFSSSYSNVGGSNYEVRIMEVHVYIIQPVCTACPSFQSSPAGSVGVSSCACDAGEFEGVIYNDDVCTNNCDLLYSGVWDTVTAPRNYVIDGDYTTIARTSAGTKVWIRLDLLQSMIVHEVTVWAGSGSYTKNAQIYTGNINYNATHPFNTLCGTLTTFTDSSLSTDSETITCHSSPTASSIKTRYVWIYKEYTTAYYLGPAEIQVKAWQFGQKIAYRYDAALEDCGGTSETCDMTAKQWDSQGWYETIPNVFDNAWSTITHTGDGINNPWMRIDLGTERIVRDVRLVTRSDCCQNRENGAAVYVGNDYSNAINNKLCGNYSFVYSIGTQQNAWVYCASSIQSSNVKSRYVFIYRTYTYVANDGIGAVINPAEIEITGWHIPSIQSAATCFACMNGFTSPAKSVAENECTCAAGEEGVTQSSMSSSESQVPYSDMNYVKFEYFGTSNQAQHTITFSSSRKCDILVVAGGGGGGRAIGGGGGAGGLIWERNHDCSGTYTIYVGKGGDGGYHQNGAYRGENGENSMISKSGFYRQAIGGGGAHGQSSAYGTANSAAANCGSIEDRGGQTGGSGGGGTRWCPNEGLGTTYQGTRQGHDGGQNGLGEDKDMLGSTKDWKNFCWQGGGGGGAFAEGKDVIYALKYKDSNNENYKANSVSTVFNAPDGGEGRNLHVFFGAGIGDKGWFAGGGGGGGTRGNWDDGQKNGIFGHRGMGGLGGGGSGFFMVPVNGWLNTGDGENGLSGTGGGGGGGEGSVSQQGGDGGSGIVVIRYADISCTQCTGNTYKSSLGSGSCYSCSANSVSNAAKTACECNAGYQPAESGGCVACPINTFKAAAGNVNCTDCRSNSETSGTGSTVDSDCECVAGYYNLNGADDCQECPQGTYKDTTGNEQNCTQCPPHSTTQYPASDEVDDCLCDKGYVGSNANDCQYQPCPEGTYKATIGTSEDETASDYRFCVDCPTGSTSPSASTASTDCVCESPEYTGPPGGPCICSAGYYNSPCQLCTANYYCLGNETQTPCPANSVSPTGSDALTDCICNVGYTGPDGGSCEGCEAGKYKNVTGSASCTNCPSYLFSDVASDAESDCICNVGYTGPDGGPCEVCVAGKYKDIIGSGNCTSCASNSYSDAGSDADTNCVCNVGYSGPDGGACTACVAGKYKDITGSAPCTDCPANSVSDEASDEEADCVCNVGYRVVNVSSPSPPPASPSAPPASTSSYSTYSASSSLDITYTQSNFIAVGVPDSSDSSKEWIYLLNDGSSQASYSVTFSAATSCDIFIFGGGGGGGGAQSNSRAAGGGGGGALITLTEQTCDGMYSITVGKGGSGGNGTQYPRHGENGYASDVTQGAIVHTAAGGGGGAGGNPVPISYTYMSNLEDCGGTPGSGSNCITDQSSYHDLTNRPAWKGIDNEYGGINKDGSGCVSNSVYGHCYYESVVTLAESVRWWRIEFNTPVVVKNVTMIGRISPYHVYGDYTKIYTGNDANSITSNALCATFGQLLSLQRVTVHCNSLKTDTPVKYLWAYQDHVSQTNRLQFAEIEIGGWVVSTQASSNVSDGLSGACGGGASDSGSGGTGSVGYNGGNGATGQLTGAGGGGMGSQGSNASSTSGGAGGTGAVSSQLPFGFCGGGGGGGYTELNRGPGAGGGSNGGAGGGYSISRVQGESYAGEDATNGYCSGGGGATIGDANSADQNGGNGAPGFVAIQYTITASGTTARRLLQTNELQTSCEACETGKYKNTSGNEECVSCPGNSTSPPASTSVTACSCNGGYAGADGGACTQCAVNAYENTSTDTCSPCPVNSQSPAGSDDVTDCICNAGYTGGVNGTACLACEVGKYKAFAGSEACTDCPANEISPLASTSVDVCVCAHGYFLNGSVCAACASGTFKNATGDGTCTNCPASSTTQQTASTSLSDCICNAGYAGEDGEVCTLCLANTYEDANVCTDCAEHSVSLEGSFTPTACKCTYDFTGPDGGPCEACESGKYKSSLGNVSCVDCPQHSTCVYLNTTGQVDVFCNAGYVENEQTCNACEAGTYQASALEPCTSCPSNSFSASASTAYTDCKCNAGYTGPDGGNCTACQANTYKNVSGSSQCEACTLYSTSPAGSVNITDCVCDADYVHAGDGSCDRVCAAGFEASLNESLCVACGHSKYKPLNGDEACTPCPANSSHSLSSQISIHACNCERGYVLNASTQVCDACEAGKFNNYAGETVCFDCYSNTSGSCEAYPFSTVYVTNVTYTDSSFVEEIQIDDTYNYIKFSNDGSNTAPYTITFSSTVLCDILIVGGGGAGGLNAGGGGGAGGLVYGSLNLSGSYSIQVGNGGQTNGANGFATSMSIQGTTITAFGGGGGVNSYGAGSNGGCGGGGASASSSTDAAGGSSTQTSFTVAGQTFQGYGNAGGIGRLEEWGGWTRAGGGGGGAGGVGYTSGNFSSDTGQSANIAYGGDGGVGILNNITGTPTYYAGGGGGSVHNDEYYTPSLADFPGLGGAGGGGNAGYPSNYVSTYASTGKDGVNGLGGGGGAGGGGNNNGGKGGSGVVIIKFQKTMSVQIENNNRVSCPDICQAPAGYEIVGTSGLQVCPVNTYNNGSYTTCLTCPDNSYTSQRGSTSILDCECQAGYFRNVESVCEACAIGTFKSDIGNSTCSVCPGNMTTISTASTACVCEANFELNDANTTCQRCPDGEVKHVVGNMSCIACTAHATLQSGYPHQISSCFCNPGYTGHHLLCSACPIGSYKDTYGSDNCTSCGELASTIFVASTNISDCVSCQAGTYEVNDTCVNCSQGFYKDIAGPQPCTPCPDPRNFSKLGANSVHYCSCQAGQMALSADVATVSAINGFLNASLNVTGCSGMPCSILSGRVFPVQGVVLSYQVQGFVETLIIHVRTGSTSLLVFKCQTSALCSGVSFIPLFAARVEYVDITLTSNASNAHEHISLYSYTRANASFTNTNFEGWDAQEAETLVTQENIQVRESIFDADTVMMDSTVCAECAPGLVCGEFVDEELIQFYSHLVTTNPTLPTTTTTSAPTATPPPAETNPAPPPPSAEI